jgi:hypothetical protein
MQECDTRQRDRLSLFGKDKCVQAHWRELLFRINMQSTVTDGLLVCQCHRPLENTHPHSYHSHCLRRTNILFRPHPLYKCPEITGFQLQGCRRAAKRLSAGRFAYLSKLPSLSAAISRIRSARVRLHPIIPLLRAVLEKQHPDQTCSPKLSPSYFDNCRWTSRHELCPRSRVWTRRPGYYASCWCVFLSFLSLPSRPEVLMDHEEGVEGSDSAQPVVQQIETPDETTPPACGCIPSGVLRPFTSMRDGSNTDHPQHNVGNQSTQAGQGSGQAEAQIRAYFLMIVEISMT